MPKLHKSLPQKNLINTYQNKIIEYKSLPQHEKDVEESMDGIY